MHAQHNHRAALWRDAGLNLLRKTCDFLTFQTLVPKLQNLGSAIWERVYQNFVRDVDELRQRLNDGWSSIEQTVIDQTIDQ